MATETKAGKETKEDGTGIENVQTLPWSGGQWRLITTNAGLEISCFPPRSDAKSGVRAAELYDEVGELRPGDLPLLLYTEREKDGETRRNLVDIKWGKDGKPVATPQEGTPQIPTRDTLIIRQTCVKAAVELAKPHIEAGRDMQTEEVLTVAERMEKWVTR